MPTDPALLEKIFTLAGLPAAGAFAHHLWARYRGRLSALRWTVRYQPMAFATDDFGWGKVEILYNGQPTKNLHIVGIELQNASSHDLEDLRVDVVADPGTVIARSSGSVRGSLRELPFAVDYTQILAEASRRPLSREELDYWGCRSPFQVPVINRTAIVDLKLLVSREDHATPQVTIGCTHKGVRLTHQPLAIEHIGVRQGQAQVAGIFLGVAIAVLAVVSGWTAWVVAAAAWVAGAFAMSIGAVAIRAWRWVVRLAD